MKKEFGDFEAYVAALVAVLSMIAYGATGSEIAGFIALAVLTAIGRAMVFHKEFNARLVRITRKTSNRK